MNVKAACHTAQQVMNQFQSNLPDKVRAVAAESRLLEEASDKLVILDFVNVLLSQSTLSGKASHGCAALLSIAVRLCRFCHSQRGESLHEPVYRSQLSGVCTYNAELQTAMNSQARCFASFSAQVLSLHPGTRKHTLSHTHKLTRSYQTPPTLPLIYLWQAELIDGDSVKPLSHLHESAQQHNEEETIGNVYDQITKHEAHVNLYCKKNVNHEACHCLDDSQCI